MPAGVQRHAPPPPPMPPLPRRPVVVRERARHASNVSMMMRKVDKEPLSAQG